MGDSRKAYQILKILTKTDQHSTSVMEDNNLTERTQLIDLILQKLYNVCLKMDANNLQNNQQT